MVPEDPPPSEQDIPTIQGDEELPSVHSTLSTRLRAQGAAEGPPTVQLDSETDAPGNGASATSSSVDSGGSDGRIAKLASQTNTEARYVLKGELGRGGMGAVLKVFDNDLRRTLAMKVIRGQKGELNSVHSHTLARFLEEAQVTGQLDHPGVVPVHELGVDQGGRVYFTMPMVKGSELKEIIALAQVGSEGWTLTKTLGIFLKICGALAYAHDKGVIHRDLKPANVMVGKYGQTYVMDWGLARVQGKQDSHDLRPHIEHGLSISEVRTDRKDQKDELSDSPLVTMDGTVVGTPYYMPPEQAAGLLEAVDARSDIYAVGAMLYHLLTGRMPYSEPGKRLSPHAVLARVLQGPPAPIHELNPNVAPELVAICDKAMARESAQRYPSTLDLEEDLRAFIESRVVSAYRTGPVIEFKSWVKRNRALATTAAAALFLVVGGTTTAAVILAGKNTEIEQEAFAAQEARAAEELARIAAERKTYLANVTLAGVGVRVGNYTDAMRSLDASPPELRDWEWRHLRLQLDPSDLTYAGVQGVVRDAVLSPDGKYIAVAGDRVVAAKLRGTLAVWNVATGKREKRFEDFKGPIQHVAFEPNGEAGWTASDAGRIRRWNFDGVKDEVILKNLVLGIETLGDTTFLFQTDEDSSKLIIERLEPRGATVEIAGSGELAAFAMDPSGGGVVTAWSDGRLLHSAADGATLGEARGLTQTVTALALFGDHVLAGTSAGSVMDWRSGGGSPRTLAGRHRDEGKSVLAVAFDPTGARFASGSEDGTTLIWSARTGAVQAMLDGHTGGALMVAFTSDGESLLTSAGGGSVRRFHAVTGNVPVVVTRMPKWIRTVAWSKDGERIFYGGSSDPLVHEIDAATGEELDAYPGHDKSVRDIAVSADGKFLVSGSLDRSLRIFDLEGASDPITVEGRTNGASWGKINGVACDPNGRWVASTAQDAVAQLWNAETGAQVAYFDDPSDDGLNAFTKAAFTPDGTRLVFAGFDEAVRVWDLTTPEILAGTAEPRQGTAKTLRYKEEPEDVDPGDTDDKAFFEKIESLAVFPDGRYAVAGDSAGFARVWDLEQEEISFELDGHIGSVWSIAVNPTGTRIATGDSGGWIRIWDAQDGSLLAKLESHERSVNALAFSPDGKRLASAGADGTLRIWDSERESTVALWRGTSANNELSQIRAAELDALRAAELDALARELVDPLVDELLLPAEVESRLRATDGIGPELLQSAVQLLSTLPPPGGDALAAKVGQILARPDASQEMLELAERLAKEAATKNPGESWLSFLHKSVLKRLGR